MPADKKRAGSLWRAFLFAIAVYDLELILIASCMRRTVRNELTGPNVVTVLLAGFTTAAASDNNGTPSQPHRL